MPNTNTHVLTQLRRVRESVCVVLLTLGLCCWSLACMCVGHWWLSREYFFSFLFLLLLLLCGFLLCLCCLGSPLLRLLLSLQLLWLCCCMGYWLWIDRSSYIRNANRARSLRLKLVATSTVDEEQQVGTKSEKRMHVLFWLENCVCMCFLLPLKKKRRNKSSYFPKNIYWSNEKNALEKYMF